MRQIAGNTPQFGQKWPLTREFVATPGRIKLIQQLLRALLIPAV